MFSSAKNHIFVINNVQCNVEVMSVFEMTMVFAVKPPFLANKNVFFYINQCVCNRCLPGTYRFFPFVANV